MVVKKILVIVVIIVYLIILRICVKRNKTLHEIMKPDLYNKTILDGDKKFKPKKNQTEYDNYVKKGFETMKTKSIVFCGLFQNSAYIFDKFKKKMETLQPYFKDMKIVVFENDSSDNSRVLLLNWEKENKNVDIYKVENNEYNLLKNDSAKNHGVFSGGRMKKMATYRNLLKTYVEQKYSNYDYYAVIDTDIRGPISLNGIAYSFGIEQDIKWDMISAFGVTAGILSLNNYAYYDQLALYHMKTYLDIFKALKYYPIKNRKIGDKPKKVKSAFCGLAIYKMASVKNVDYTPKDGNYICEHIIFHNNMIDKGHENIFINPNMLILAGKQGKAKDYFAY